MFRNRTSCTLLHLKRHLIKSSLKKKNWIGSEPLFESTAKFIIFFLAGECLALTLKISSYTQVKHQTPCKA